MIVLKISYSTNINIEGSLMLKARLIIFTNPTNEGGEQILDENMSCRSCKLNDSCTDKCECKSCPLCD